MNKAAANDIHNISVDNQTHQSASAASTSAPPPLTPSQPQANASAATPNLAKGSTVTVKKTASKLRTNPNIITLLVFSKPKTSAKTSLTIYTIGKISTAQGNTISPVKTNVLEAITLLIIKQAQKIPTR